MQNAYVLGWELHTESGNLGASDAENINIENINIEL